MPYGDPKFTVVNPSPDFDQSLRSLRVSDYLGAAAISSGSWAYGYVFGKPTRIACANTAGDHSPNQGYTGPDGITVHREYIRWTVIQTITLFQTQSY